MASKPLFGLRPMLRRSIPVMVSPDSAPEAMPSAAPVGRTEVAALPPGSPPSPPALPDPAESAYAVTPPVYSGTSRILSWSHNGRTGMTAKLRLDNLAAGDPHPFKGMRWNARAADGQRFRLVLSRLEPQGEVGLFVGEAMLSWWAEDCAVGHQVMLRLDSGPDGADARHPLAGMAQGARNGDVVHLACWVVGDDELPQPPGAVRQPARASFSQMTPTRQAAIKCSDPEFRRWCRDATPSLLTMEDLAKLPPWSDQTAYAESVVRLYCRVESRSELSQDTPAGQAGRGYWAEMLRRYNAWRLNEPPPPGD